MARIHRLRRIRPAGVLSQVRQPNAQECKILPDQLLHPRVSLRCPLPHRFTHLVDRLRRDLRLVVNTVLVQGRFAGGEGIPRQRSGGAGRTGFGFVGGHLVYGCSRELVIGDFDWVRDLWDSWGFQESRWVVSG
ncbi:hypothetical protein L1049_001003 [Liquidambar formosana]|uniref:Uncharacterized protein n=1 Tax=Liquidambar formosana TaxID=63359 RepID=A0AAP0R5S4_LIQFO